MTFRLYLIGDAGNAPKGIYPPFLQAIEKRLTSESKPSACVWLGDNIYPVGLAPSDHSDYAVGKHRIYSQLRTTLKYAGKVFFIPGNHDWYTYGKAGINREETLVEETLTEYKELQSQTPESYFLPDSGCLGPSKVSLMDDILLIIVDSQRWLDQIQNPDKRDSICHDLSTIDLENELEKILTENQEKSVIIASHHPPLTYGNHGGKYTIGETIFPLTQLRPSLFIPLPISGILFNTLSSRFSVQDQNHPAYKYYRKKIIEIASKHGNTAIASGHEHNLQYHEKKNVPLIVSGAGSKRTSAGMGPETLFAIGEQGYVTIEFLSESNKVIRYWAFINNKIQEVYRNRIISYD